MTLNSKLSMLLPLVTFLISLLFFTAVTQGLTGILTENRRSTLLTTLSENQLDSGGFSAFTLGMSTSGDAYHTAQILMILNTLEALERIRVDDAVNHILTRQHVSAGNSKIWGWPVPAGSLNVSDLYIVDTVLTGLSLVNALNSVNKTALVEFALSRYNHSSGAFFEPVYQLSTSSGVREISFCYFPLEFYANSDLAYSESNLISTSLGVSVLATLDALSEINTTRTLQWIKMCRAENAMFAPFPGAKPDYLPPWSSLATNPFYVDNHGTGLAYTYAALRALNMFAGLDDTDAVKDAMQEYVLSCQENASKGAALHFRAHTDDQKHTTGIGSRHYTYYAIRILYYIDRLEAIETVSEGVTDAVLMEQNLLYRDTWPLPDGPGYYGDVGKGNVYSLFLSDFLPVSATRFSIAILNWTDSLGTLDEPTPVAVRAWINLSAISILLSLATIPVMLVYKKLRCVERIPGTRLKNNS